MQCRLNCCAGYVLEENESRCVSKYMYKYTHSYIVPIMLTLQIILNLNHNVSKEHISRENNCYWRVGVGVAMVIVCYLNNQILLDIHGYFI